MTTTPQGKAGLLAAIAAYGAWGVLPVYWKAMDGFGAYEIVCHRILWAMAFTATLLLIQGKVRSLLLECGNGRNLVTFTSTALLQASNWLVYIWAVNNGHIIESSLGYFINPLISVFLGVLFLHERLRPMQWLALAIAAAGVLYLTLALGKPPWISLFLAISFASYALLRKTARLPSLEGLFFETLLLSPGALFFLLALSRQNTLASLLSISTDSLLLTGAGIVTAVPLLLFVFAAQRITMTSIGLLQYLAPTLQFLLGVLYYHEPFPPAKLTGFAIIWAALAVYSVEGILMRCRQYQRLHATKGK